MVIMQCLEPVTNRPTGQLILDYLTDSVIGVKPNLPGVPYISPDSRKLVTLDKTTNGATLIVQEITGKLKICNKHFCNKLSFLREFCRRKIQ